MSRPAPATKRKSIYGVHPGVLMTQKWIAELKEKQVGPRKMGQHIKKAGPKGEMNDDSGSRLNMDSEQTRRRGWLNVQKARISKSGDPDLYLESAERDVDKMYSGGKAASSPYLRRSIEAGFESR